MTNLEPVLAATSAAQFSATVAAWVTVGIYVVVAVFAYVQIRDARTTRRAANRPYVFVDFDLSEAPMIWLTLQNVGTTAARDVRFDCDPPMTSTITTSSNYGGILDREWPYLPPRKEVRTLYDSAIARLAEPPPLPLRYTVTATYKDAQTKQDYRDSFVLDIETYRNLMYTQKKSLNDLVKSIDDFAKRFSSDSSGGLRVLVRDYQEWTHEREELIEKMRQQAAHLQSSPETTGPDVVTKESPNTNPGAPAEATQPDEPEASPPIEFEGEG